MARDNRPPKKQYQGSGPNTTVVDATLQKAASRTVTLVTTIIDIHHPVFFDPAIILN